MGVIFNELFNEAFHLHGIDFGLLKMLLSFEGKKSMVFAVIMEPQSTLPYLINMHMHISNKYDTTYFVIQTSYHRHSGKRWVQLGHHPPH